MTAEKIIAPLDADQLQAGHPDTSTIQLSIHPAEYLASAIARAIEDADTYLLGLSTETSSDGYVIVTIRISTPDPAAAVRSLERYGFNVTSAIGPADSRYALAAERINELKLYLDL